MDKKDYTGTETVFRRPSVRAVIHRDGKLLLVWVKKYDYYKFPGGGFEQGESAAEALIREVREETGCEVIPETIREYGHVTRKQRSTYHEHEIFEQDNLYYFCDVKGEPGSQHLDDYEAEAEFTPVWMYPFEAYRVNRDNAAGYKDPDSVTREARVLEMVDKHLRNEARRQREETAVSEMAETGAALGSAVTAEDYEKMIAYVGKTLGEGESTDPVSVSELHKKGFGYSRFAHIKRVLGWARRLYGAYADKDALDYEAIMIATVFHDVGRAAAEAQKISHAKAGEPITEKYLLEYGLSEERAKYIGWLVGTHSDKHLMRQGDIDKNLLILMEADLLDDMGALGVVMDCMSEMGKNPEATFEDSYDHIMRYSHPQLQANPMVTPAGKAFWNEHKALVEAFANHMLTEMSI